MQLLEVSCAVRRIYMSLGAKRVQVQRRLPAMESWVHFRLPSCKLLCGQSGTEAGPHVSSFMRFSPGVILAHCFGLLIMESNPGRPEFSTNAVIYIYL